MFLSNSQELFQNEDRFLFSLGTDSMMLPQSCILSLFSLRSCLILSVKKTLFPLLKADSNQCRSKSIFLIRIMLNLITCNSVKMNLTIHLKRNKRFQPLHWKRNNYQIVLRYGSRTGHCECSLK